ncbi:MAG: type II toxin-antitoxin system RelE/ParE family toxin [Bacteroidota bacterium]
MEKKIRKVNLSSIFDDDLADIFNYGLETFGINLAELFVANIYQHINELPLLFLIYPECRHLETKAQIYRNIILGKYLIIYRIKAKKIEVLRALHGSQSPEVIKATKKIKTK